ncbi:hypothetical protein KBY75_06250 [Cyanobium sp. T1G-Tous]|uniref:hypothetical protein n=1 Tax=unclassified Cyanobium TaxID=2627006 RepID=UPI0020CEA01D|nr:MULTISPECIES: hypothetical protein [unclassified Cyanobium]MCP9779010.1 hypothetical protein [Cyanobium sp. Tous-M-B4]MCP9803167.1 hypothetical protein [Cyanobium sp. T1G-Tous]MCP9876314.1 hypothetical protein [Cyanobium sp. A2C-AMD]
MPRSRTWLWLLLALLLLLAPGPAGRFVLDLLGGITLLLVFLPLLLGAAGFVAWQVIQSRLRTCESCGFASMEKEFCPACGSAFSASASGSESGEQFDVSNVTIDVQVVNEENPSP